jgi:transcriptional regulator with XRE-family HTH domain
MDKKLKNELFRVAVDYLFKEKKVESQKELAEKIGITEQSLSRVMNGGRTVSDKTLRLMNEAFGGIFNMAYFRGEDPHCMLMEDLFYYKQHPEERLVFEKPNSDNPSLLESANSIPVPSSVDPSSAINAAIAAYVELTNRLKQEMADRLADKETIIAEKQSRIVALEQTVSDKDAIIRARDARILELERQIANINASDLSRYPFAIGAAEPEKRTNVSPYKTESSRKHP